VPGLHCNITIATRKFPRRLCVLVCSSTSHLVRNLNLSGVCSCCLTLRLFNILSTNLKISLSPGSSQTRTVKKHPEKDVLVIEEARIKSELIPEVQACGYIRRKKVLLGMLKAKSKIVKTGRRSSNYWRSSKGQTMRSRQALKKGPHSWNNVTMNYKKTLIKLRNGKWNKKISEDQLQ